jgi:ATP adenylyltransferase
MWTPWRMKFITGKKPKGCIFCKVLKSKKNNQVLFRGTNAFVILNIYPYSNGHLMVVTNRHIGSLDRLTSDEILELGKLTKLCTNVLSKAVVPEGFNIGLNVGKVAGAGIPGHIHVHIVPRWTGDTNFMPVISETKIIPEALDETYKKLKKHFVAKNK